MPIKIFTQELEGTRRRGKPRKRWKEEEERDLQVLGARRWRELVADRKKWKEIVRQAKAHSGLQCQWKKKKKKIYICVYIYIYIYIYIYSNAAKDEISFTFIYKFINN